MTCNFFFLTKKSPTRHGWGGVSDGCRKKGKSTGGVSDGCRDLVAHLMCKIKGHWVAHFWHQGRGTKGCRSVIDCSIPKLIDCDGLCWHACMVLWQSLTDNVVMVCCTNDSESIVSATANNTILLRKLVVVVTLMERVTISQWTSLQTSPDILVSTTIDDQWVEPFFSTLDTSMFGGVPHRQTSAHADRDTWVVCWADIED